MKNLIVAFTCIFVSFLARASDWRTQLLAAIEANNPAQVREVLKTGVNPDVLAPLEDSKRFNPEETKLYFINVAVAFGNREIIQDLLKSGASVWRVGDADGDAWYTLNEAIRVALQRKNDESIGIVEDLVKAAGKRSVEYVNTPVRKDPHPLVKVTRENSDPAIQLRLVELLLNAGSKIEGTGNCTPLLEAARNADADYQVVQLLMSRGANINALCDDEYNYSRSILTQLKSENYRDRFTGLITLLESKGATDYICTKGKKCTPPTENELKMTAAIENQDPVAVRNLLIAGVPINGMAPLNRSSKYKYGRGMMSFLTLAVDQDAAEVVGVMLARDASVFTGGWYRQVQLASETLLEGYVKSILSEKETSNKALQVLSELVVGAGPERTRFINQKTSSFSNVNILIGNIDAEVAEDRQIEVLEILLAGGGKLDMSPNYSALYTLLYARLTQSRQNPLPMKLIKFLVDSGADLNVKVISPVCEQSLLSFLEKYGDKRLDEVIPLLVSKGAKSWVNPEKNACN